MCHRHSFIVTRAGNVFHGMGITDSHTTIREMAGLGTNDSSTYAFEWQPPPNWPDSNAHAGLTQDTAPIPNWDMTAKHVNAIERHLRNRYPDIDAWNRADPLPTAAELRAAGWSLLKDGDTTSVSLGDMVYVTSGNVVVTQTGGYCLAYGSATLNATAQTGGYCLAYGRATLNATAQTGGDCLAHDSSTLNSTDQTGGDCLAYGRATLNATAQTGGGCRAYGRSTMNSTAQ